MNRKQAEHILDAYINLECAGGDNNARAALREVILDVMSSYVMATTDITWPTAKPPNILTNKHD